MRDRNQVNSHSVPAVEALDFTSSQLLQFPRASVAALHVKVEFASPLRLLTLCDDLFRLRDLLSALRTRLCRPLSRVTTVSYAPSTRAPCLCHRASSSTSYYSDQLSSPVTPGGQRKNVSLRGRMHLKHMSSTSGISSFSPFTCKSSTYTPFT